MIETALPPRVQVRDEKKIWDMAKRGAFTLNISGTPRNRGVPQAEALGNLAGTDAGAVCEAADAVVDRKQNSEAEIWTRLLLNSRLCVRCNSSKMFLAVVRNWFALVPLIPSTFLSAENTQV